LGRRALKLKKSKGCSGMELNQKWKNELKRITSNLGPKWIGRLKTLALVGVLLWVTHFIFSPASWKEEAVLHDGSTLIVKRTQRRGGFYEIGQSAPISEHSIAFTLPGSGKRVIWKGEYGRKPEDHNLMLLAVDVVDGIPYLVAVTLGYIAYSQWGCPNPPYVFLKLEGDSWQRVPLEQFPAEIKQANLVVSTKRFERNLSWHWGVVDADEVRAMNKDLKHYQTDYLLSFSRVPIKVPATSECRKVIYDEKTHGWHV